MQLPRIVQHHVTAAFLGQQALACKAKYKPWSQVEHKTLEVVPLVLKHYGGFNIVKNSLQGIAVRYVKRPAFLLRQWPAHRIL